jgi:hypothetical protein
MTADWNQGVLGHIKHDLVVRELNGTLFNPALPSRERWKAMLAHYAPGCGSPTRVAGTNGGTMPCGAWLTQLDGSRTQEFCPNCKPCPTATLPPIHRRRHGSEATISTENSLTFLIV